MCIGGMSIFHIISSQSKPELQKNEWKKCYVTWYEWVIYHCIPNGISYDSDIRWFFQNSEVKGTKGFQCNLLHLLFKFKWVIINDICKFIYRCIGQDKLNLIFLHVLKFVWECKVKKKNYNRWKIEGLS